MLAMAGKNSVVESSVPGLADFARISIEECRISLAKLMAPDPDSRTKEHEGRRIKEVEGGWLILNHSKYREKMSKAERADYMRNYRAEGRDKGRSVNELVTNGNTGNTNVTPVRQSESESEAYTESVQAEREYPEAIRPSLSEILAKADLMGLAPWKAEDWFNEMEGCGWRDHKNRTIQNWISVMTRVKVKWESDGRPESPPKPRNNVANGNSRPLSVLDLRTVIQTKEALAVKLKNTHYSPTAIGGSWDSDAPRQEWNSLRQEIKTLNYKLSKMA